MNIAYKKLEEEVYKTTNWHKIHTKLGLSMTAIYQKRKGLSDWKLSECLTIKELTGSPLSLDELFKKDYD